MLPSAKPIILQRIDFDKAAEEYVRSLPLEHFMESTTQSRQREITVSSFRAIQTRRPDIQLFSELLVQYRIGKSEKLRQVCPDNMVVVCNERLKVDTNFAVPLQPAAPYWMFEYVSKSNLRKDYEDSFDKYERELKVPYYLVFHPAEQELTLFRLRGKTYRGVVPTRSSHFPVPELEIEVAIQDGWMRFWFRGELMPVTEDLLQAVEREKRRAEASEQEVARLRAEIERLRKRNSKKNGR